MAKAEVCKTSIHRFESDRRLSLMVGVAEFGRRRDLKSMLYQCKININNTLIEDPLLQICNLKRP